MKVGKAMDVLPPFFYYFKKEKKKEIIQVGMSY